MTTLTAILSGLLTAPAQIPGPDPLGFPLPPWILQALAYLTLTLHLLAMNFTVGGVILFLWARFRKIPAHEGITRFFGGSFPLGVSYIITLGIPPLLFVQVLYGQLFYASSVIIGSFWIQVIPVMLLAYTGFYYHKFLRRRRPRGQLPVVIGSGLLLLYVGFIYVNNFTLGMSPEKFAALYAAHPAGGVLLHGEPTLLPRFLLFLSGALAAAGLALLWRGNIVRRWGFSAEVEATERFGRRAVLLTPVLWLVAAAGLLLTRGSDLTALWREVPATPWLFLTGLAGAVVLIVFAGSGRSETGTGRLIPASAGLVVSIASIVIFRDLARLWALRDSFRLTEVPVNVQWGMFALFVVTLAAGVVFLIVLAGKVLPVVAGRAREEFAARID